MNETVERIKGILVENSIPVFGIADSTFKDGNGLGYRCSDTLLSAKSILCLGMPFPRGVFHCESRTNETYWRAANIYYKNIDMVLLQIARIIEEQDELAVPVFG